MKAIVLAGGKGNRVAPFATILPKPLMPIGEMPILEVMLRQMKFAGIEEVVLAVGHLAGLLETFFQDGSQWGLKISYSLEEEPLGTAGAIALVEGLDEPFLVTNGDVLTTLDLRKLVRYHKKKGGIATVAIQRRPVEVDLGVVEWDEEHMIKGYIEKPTLEYPVSMGLYVYEPRVLQYIPRGQFLNFPDLILKLLAAGEKVVGYEYDGYWKDLGRADDYEQAGEEFEKLRNRLLPEEV
jgi:NDP-sugar pyrophosphorylase family protein